MAELLLTLTLPHQVSNIFGEYQIVDTVCATQAQHGKN